jgi:YbbR domain-containing protein
MTARRTVALLTENLTSKLLSLAAAVLLWIALVDAPELTTTVEVPIQFRNFPAGLDIASQTGERVSLQVRGPRAAMSSGAFSRTAAILDLSSMKDEGARTFNIQEAITDLPARISVVRAVPNQIRVALERHVSRAVPVLPPTLPPGYRLSRYTISPPTVVISGPASQVEAVGGAQTDPVDSGTIRKLPDDAALDVRLQTFVDNPRVRIDSVSVVDVKLYIERIRD